jgi:RHS repeat-associated protein
VLQVLNWLLTDNQGTVRDVAQYDSNTNTTSVVDHIVYDAFGKVTYQTTSLLSKQSRFTYAGMRLDGVSGLYYDNARWYDPANGVFIGQDPMGFAAGDTNISRYCGNSPTNMVDPSGMIENDVRYKDPIVFSPILPFGLPPGWHAIPADPGGNGGGTGPNNNGAPVGMSVHGGSGGQDYTPSVGDDLSKIPSYDPTVLDVSTGDHGMPGISSVNRPMWIPPPPKFGFGLTGGTAIEGGAVGGGSAQYSKGIGYFSNSKAPDGLESFTTYGSFAYSSNGGYSAVQNPNPLRPDNPGTVFGAAVTFLGIQGFLTNAGDNKELSGPMATVNVSFLIYGGQISWVNGPNGTIWFVSGGFAKGAGLSVSAYPTTTEAGR